MKTTRIVFVGLLLAGCASPPYQLEYKLSGVNMPWRPSGTPVKEDLCYRGGADLSTKQQYLDGKWYTVIARCVKVEDAK